MAASIGRAQAKPTSPASGTGRHSAISPGSTLSVQANAISMPVPAISPSCATPANEVGVKAKNPAEVDSDATRICAPLRRPAAPSAEAVSACVVLASRKRTVNWMAKSTASPTNSTAKATETRFRGAHRQRRKRPQ